MNRMAVVGGGPAGAAAALGLLRRGLDVEVFERRARWTGRVCGAFLSPEAVGHLRWLGLSETARGAGAAEVRAVRVASAWGFDRTLPLPASGLALPRRALEEILLDAVRRAGGRVTLGPAAVASTPSVLAAGRFGGDPPPKGGRGWYGWNAVFQGAGRRPGDMSLHFGPGIYVGTLAFSDGSMNMSGLLYKDAPVGWSEVFQRCRDRMPSLREDLGPARRATEWTGVGPLPHGTKIIPRPGVFPAGDAAAVGDPFFGEGIGRALAAGRMLFDAWGAPDPWAAYHRAWDRAFRRRLRTGALLRNLLRRPLLLKLLLPALARPPLLSLFSHLKNP
jgi:flavin-dependent dehydrogenase